PSRTRTRTRVLRLLELPKQLNSTSKSDTPLQRGGGGGEFALKRSIQHFRPDQFAWQQFHRTTQRAYNWVGLVRVLCA
ncbi:unnamed protein product, partial [Protopolystoma xenopodis]